MNRIVVLGEPERVGGYRLAGATVVEATEPAAVEQAWQALPADTTLLVLTPRAASIVGARLRDRVGLVWAVMPV